MITRSGGAIETLSRQTFERGVHYCLPSAILEGTGAVGPASPTLTISSSVDRRVHLEWLGGAYVLEQPGRSLTPNEIKLVRSIGLVLSARYRMFLDSARAVERLDLFRGVPEDRFVSAYLDPTPYMRGDGPPLDRVASAIEVLRISSSSTYENRRINTGVLLVGTEPDRDHDSPPSPEGALSYAQALTTTRTFYRLSDGMRTAALVDTGGLMVELIDIEEWAAACAPAPLPAPCGARFAAHCRATQHGGHICLVLTPNGEIKAFAEGMQMFNFLEGRWRLSDMSEKYGSWSSALDHPPLAERLFTTALNLAERRRGGLLVVLDDAADAMHLVPMADQLNGGAPAGATSESKQQFHYLLRGKSVLDLTPTVLESIARIDGAIVSDRSSNLLAFGTILRHHRDPALEQEASEGGRTAAAIAASRFGHVLKISEDGIVSFYAGGRAQWEI